MKLFFVPGHCSMAAHIALYESGLKFATELVDTKSKKTKSGADYSKINLKGAVPALQLDNGEVLTEGAVIMQYIADQKPEKNLIPAAGTFARYRCQEWLNYIASDIHKGYAPLWSDEPGEIFKETVKNNMYKRFDYISEKLSGQDFLMGQQFTIADAYLFTVLRWTKLLKIDLSKWPVLMGYCEKVMSRPAVQATLKAESATQ